MYSLIHNQKKIYENIVSGYADFLKRYSFLPYSPLTYLAYSIANMKTYDLDCNVAIVGEARSGKSTLSLLLSELVFLARNNYLPAEIDDKLGLDLYQLIHDNIIYSSSYPTDALKKARNTQIIIDEAYFTLYRRMAMTYTNIQYLQVINAFANKNNIIYTNIQNSADLDTSLINKANVFIMIYERGRALAFAKSKNFPIVKSGYDFERFQKELYLLKSKDVGLANLRRNPNYLFKIKWWDLENSAKIYEREMWNFYKMQKAKWQAKV